MDRSTHHQLLKLSFILFSILSFIYPSTLARPLSDNDRFITFFINDALDSTTTSPFPITENIRQLPFSQLTGLFNSRDDMPRTNPRGHGSCGRTEASIGWLPFLTSVQALEAGNLTVIEEELIGSVHSAKMELTLKGKVQGIYVGSSVDQNSCMVAMRAVFGDERSKDSLRFFGEHQLSLPESHIAVVGGTGRYHGANGFAVVKATDQEVKGRTRMKKKLLFNVYIK